MSYTERLLKFGTKAALRAIAAGGALSLSSSLLIGCGTSQSSTSAHLSVSFPQAAIQAASSSSSTYDFSRACFAINVTSSDIPSAKKNSCDVSRGIFQGFVAPGGSVTLTVPKGSARKLEVFSYLRASAAASCQSLVDFGSFAPNKITRVGLVPTFDTQTDNVTLDVTLTAPATSDNLVTQYSLASTCSVGDAQQASSAAITSGHVHSTGGKLVIEASISGQKNNVHLSGGALQIQLSRSSQ